MSDPSESTTQPDHNHSQELVDHGNLGFAAAAVFGRYENDSATNGAAMSEQQLPTQMPQMMLNVNLHNQQQIQNQQQQQQQQLFLQQPLASHANFLQQNNMAAAAFGPFGFHNPFAFGALNPMMFANAGSMATANGGTTNSAASGSDNSHDEAANDAYQRGRQDTIMHLFRAGAGMGGLAGLPTLPSFPGMVNPRVKGPPVIQNEEFLMSLGSNCLERRAKNVPYFDSSTMADPDPVSVANRRTRGGVTEPFPEKLHRMIREAEKNGKPDVLSFFPHGRSFAIHKPERFCAEIMSKYFKQSRLSSFQRQLNLYGFTRINSGPDAGGYYHELFLRGRPGLSIHICRVGVPQAMPRRRGVKAHDSMKTPDFYSMPPITLNEKNNGFFL